MSPSSWRLVSDENLDGISGFAPERVEGFFLFCFYPFRLLSRCVFPSFSVFCRFEDLMPEKHQLAAEKPASLSEGIDFPQRVPAQVLREVGFMQMTL